MERLMRGGVWTHRLDDPDLVRLFHACWSRRRDGRFERDVRSSTVRLADGRPVMPLMRLERGPEKLDDPVAPPATALVAVGRPRMSERTSSSDDRLAALGLRSLADLLAPHPWSSVTITSYLTGNTRGCWSFPTCRLLWQRAG